MSDNGSMDHSNVYVSLLDEQAHSERDADLLIENEAVEEDEEDENRVIAVRDLPRVDRKPYASFRRTLVYAPWLQNLLQLRLPWDSSAQLYGQGILSEFIAREKAMNSLWSLVLFGVLGRDFYYYNQYPDDRYGNTWWNLLSGFAPNPAAWSSHGLSDLVSDTPNYLAAPLALLGMSFLYGSGFVNASYDFFRGLYEDDGDGYIGNQREDFRTQRNNPYVGLPFKRLSELNLSRYRFQSMSFPCGQEDIQHIVNDLYATVMETSGLVLPMSAISQLAEVADSFYSEDSERLKAICRIKQLPENCADSALEKSQMAVRALKKIASSKDLNHVTRLYAKYTLWRLGEKRPLGANLLFWPFVLLQSFAQYRYWLLLVRKIMGVSQFFNERENCITQNKIFRYSPERAQEVCGICNDWPFVPYGSTNNTQACLEGLLREIQPPGQLTQNLQRFVWHDDFTHIDLSHQPWQEQWTEQQWSGLLDGLTEIVKRPLAVLDVSGADYYADIQLGTKVERLAAFVEHSMPDTLNVSYNEWSGRDLIRLWPGLVNNRTRVLDLSATRLSDNAILSFAEQIPATNLTTLYLNRCNMTDTSLNTLSVVLPNTTLQQLYMANNHFAERGIAALSAVLPSTDIDVLDISDIPLKATATAPLFKALAEANTTQLWMSNCQLQTESFFQLSDYIRNMSLLGLDISRNRLTRMAAHELFPQFSGLGLRYLQMRAMHLDETVPASLGKVLPTMVLEHFDISDNDLLNGSRALFAGVVESSMQKFVVRNAKFDDEALRGLIYRLAVTPNQLTSLDLSNNPLTGELGLKLIDAAANSSLVALKLANTGLNDAAMDQIATHLPKWRLSEIDVSGNQIRHGVAAIAPHLAASQLRIIRASSNRIPTEGIFSLAEQSIEPMLNAERLGDRVLSVAQRRDMFQRHANSLLETLDVSFNNVSNRGARALCRASERAGFEVSLKGNPLTAVGLFKCQTSSATRTRTVFSSVAELAKKFLASLHYLMRDTRFIVGSLLFASVLTSYFVYRSMQTRKEPEKSNAPLMARGAMLV